MLQGAVVYTKEKPEEPRKASAWVAMNLLMMEIAALEDEIIETVSTPNGEQQIKIVVLNQDGGKMRLTDDAFNLLNRLWAVHRDTNLNFAQARHVAITEQFLKSAEHVADESLSENN